MLIGIISYLPSDKILRSKRKELFSYEINQLFSLTDSRDQILVNAQSYRDEDYLKSDNIEYIVNPKGVGPSRARNEILDRFYQSDEDFLVLLDDDVIIEDTEDNRRLFNLLSTCPQRFNEVDAISGLDLIHSRRHQLPSSEFYLTTMNVSGNNGLIILRNINKYYSRRPYYDLTHSSSCEDTVFRVDELSKVRSYLCHNLTYCCPLLGEDSSLGHSSVSRQKSDYCFKFKEILEERGLTPSSVVKSQSRRQEPVLFIDKSL